MEVRKICQWCGKPFIAKKTTTCYCSHQCSNLVVNGVENHLSLRKQRLAIAVISAPISVTKNVSGNVNAR